MFDRNNPADLASLKSEVNTDPISMGYDPVGPTQQILKLLNESDNNVGADTISRPFDASAMIDALVPTELDAQQTNAKAAEYTHILVELAAFSDISVYKTKWRSMFAANSDTVAALDAQVRAISRAEVLFGAGTNISKEDWFAARDS